MDDNIGIAVASTVFGIEKYYESDTMSYEAAVALLSNLKLPTYINLDI